MSRPTARRPKTGGLRCALSAAACAALTLLAAAQPAAHASDATLRAVVHDGAHDAPKAIDIRRVDVRQTAHRVSIGIKVARLSRAARAEFVVYGSFYTGEGFVGTDVILTTWTDKKHRVRTLLQEGEDAMPTRCKGLHVTWRPRTDTVAISSPRTCGEAWWHGRKFQVRSDFDYDAHKRGHDKTRVFKVHP